MFRSVDIPLWLLVLILAFAAVTFASHFLFPSVQWFFRRRMERAVSELNKRLQRPVEPFKLLERHDRIQQLVYDPEVLAAVLTHARDNGVPRSVAFQTAKRYAAEIVPGFSASVYFGFSVRFARWLSQLLYRVRVNTVQGSPADQLDPNATVIFVMNHRSNMDYVLVTWLVSKHMTLSYAVGEWARVWPLSWLIRSMGAYFIRRKHLNPLYRKILERYVQISTTEGVTQAIFPEGRLSLDGKTAPAKLGLLSYILSEAKKSGRKVIFVPVGLNYDRVLEDRLLVKAQVSGINRFQAKLMRIMLYVAKMLWLRAWGKWDGFGEAAVSFGAPVELSKLLADDPALTPEDLGQALMQGVGKVIPVPPVPLVAAAVGRDGIPRAQLPAAVEALKQRLQAAGAVLSLPEGDAQALIDEALPPLLGRGILSETAGRLRPANHPLYAFHTAPLQQILDADAARPSQEIP